MPKTSGNLRTKSHAKKSYTNIFISLGFAITAIFGAISCSGGGGGGGSDSITANGTVTKGPVAGAKVSVASINADGSIGVALGDTTTTADGKFSFTGAVKKSTAFVSTGGKYADEVTGDQITLGSDSKLVCLQPAGLQKNGDVTITPITTAAASQAIKWVKAGASADLAIASANIQVAAQFGLAGVDIGRTKPVDLTNPSGFVDPASGEAKYGVAIAAFVQSAHDAGLQSADIPALVQNTADDLTDGVLDGKNDGAALSHNLAVSPAQVMTSLTAGATAFLGGSRNAAGIKIGQISFTPTPVTQKPGTSPNKPTDITATDTGTAITLTWAGDIFADSYNVYIGTAASLSTGSYTSKITGATNPYSDTKITAGTTYYYAVTAVNSHGESTASEVVSVTAGSGGGDNGGGDNGGGDTSTAPSAPTGLVATSGESSVTLSWTASSNASSYNIYWSTASGVTTSSHGGKITGATSPYVQTGLTSGTAYYYIVTAVNSVGESAPSAETSATPSAGKPAAPTNVVATSGTESVQITWEGPQDAASYNIYWSHNAGVTVAAGTKIEGATSPYTHGGLIGGGMFYYIVTTVGSTGQESDPSGEVGVEAAKLVPPAPATVTVYAGHNSASIAWAAVDIAESYNIYWGTETGSTGNKIENAVSPYHHTSLTSGATYYYTVVSVRAGVESAPSAEKAVVAGEIKSLYYADAHFKTCTTSTGKTLTGQVDTLDCPGMSISSIVGIDQFPNLRNIDLRNNNLTDISLLAYLPGILTLNIANNNISVGVAQLANLSNPVSITLSGNVLIPCGDLNVLIVRFGSSVVDPYPAVANTNCSQ